MTKLTPFNYGRSVDDYPHLASLRLDRDDIVAIANQGFIAAERREKRTYHKLRFRRDGQQRVRYIGSAIRAVAVQAELDTLQRGFHLQRHVAVLSKSVASALRTARETIQPLAELQGYYFHGHALRKRRNSLN